MGERLAPRPPSAARPRTPWNSPLLDFPRVPFLQTLGHRDRIRREHRPEGPPVHELPKAGCPTSDQSGSWGRCGGEAAWRRVRGSHIAEAPWAAVAARRGRRERKRRRRAERLQRRRLPAASGSCAQLTAGAAGVVCVALPDTLRVRLPRGLLRWQRPRAVGPLPRAKIGVRMAEQGRHVLTVEDEQGERYAGDCGLS